MSGSGTSTTTRTLYVALIEAHLRSVPLNIPSAANVLRIERGLVYPLTALGRSAVDIAVPPGAAGQPVVDAAGHCRPVYRGLLFYSVFQAMRLSADARRHESAWRARFAEELALLPRLADADPLPAAAGATVTDTVWMAIATHAAGESARAHSLIQPVLDRQTPKGYFLAAAPDDNPESHWYHELVILHAIATFAFQTGNAACAAATVIATGAHQRETQPDHATHQPWGLHAFVRNPATLAMADQILHSATTLGGTSGVTSILLADALYCLRL